MTHNEMCKWLSVPEETPVPRRIAETLSSFRYPATAAEDRQVLSACLAWTAPRRPLPPARVTGFESKIWSGFSF